MPENCVVMGAKGKLEMDGVRFQFTRLVQKTVKLKADNSQESITGVLDPPGENIMPTTEIVGFDVYMEPSVDEFKSLVPLFLCDGSSSIWTSGDTAKSFTSVIDYGTVIHQYTGCKVNVALLSGQKGDSFLRLVLQIYAVAETKKETHSFGSKPFGAGYVFDEGVIELRGANYMFDMFQLQVNRKLYRDFNNSVTATCIVPSGNHMTLQTRTNYTDGSPNPTDLYWAEKADNDGTAGYLGFGRGASSLEFEFALLKPLVRPPSITGKNQPIKYPNSYDIYAKYTSTEKPAITATFDAIEGSGEGSN